MLTNQRASFEVCSFNVTAESNFVMSQETWDKDKDSLTGYRLDKMSAMVLYRCLFYIVQLNLKALP